MGDKLFGSLNLLIVLVFSEICLLCKPAQGIELKTLGKLFSVFNDIQCIVNFLFLISFSKKEPKKIIVS